MVGGTLPTSETSSTGGGPDMSADTFTAHSTGEPIVFDDTSTPTQPPPPALPEGKVKRILLNKDGLPRNSQDWTEEDWADLYRAYQRVVKRVSERHKPKGKP